MIYLLEGGRIGEFANSVPVPSYSRSSVELHHDGWPTMNSENPLRVLFADDEESFRVSLSRYLTEKGYIVRVAATGEETLVALREQEFDVIVLDYNMPGGSGLNVLQWMLEQKLDTPVVVLTGAGSEHIAVEAMKLGAYDYVVKDQIDLHHLPIIINGVYERYLFKKDKEALDSVLQTREDIRSSIETFEKAIYSLSHVANNSLSLLSLNLQDYVRNFAAPVLTQDAQLLSNAAMEEIKKDVDVVNSTIKSMLNLATAMQHRLSAETGIASIEGAIQKTSDAIMEKHKARMGQ